MADCKDASFLLQLDVKDKSEINKLLDAESYKKL